MLDYDVGLLKTAQEFIFSTKIAPIRYDTGENAPIPDGTMLRVTGYGETLNENDDPNFLRAVFVPKVPTERCKEKYSNYSFPITHTMICAGFVDGGHDACQGDSGGALTDADGFLIGVVSWGIGCAQPGYPGVYARLSVVAKWVDEVFRLF